MQSVIKILVNSPSQFTPKHALEATALMISGQSTPAQTSAFLIAFKYTQLESHPEYLAAIAQGLLKDSLKLELPNDLMTVDIVGTGGDGQDTFNVSTASAIVAAGSGCKVAKVHDGFLYKLAW